MRIIHVSHGATYNVDDKLTLRAGIAYDETLHQERMPVRQFRIQIVLGIA